MKPITDNGILGQITAESGKMLYLYQKIVGIIEKVSSEIPKVILMIRMPKFRDDVKKVIIYNGLRRKKPPYLGKNLYV